ncbi:MAG: N-acetylmannosaminyltransferase [Capsulimonas sp.]|jgi:N-acetylglucosaminyldiphosphoundecaprenol N-acetyl-beta-D-mannosaminyltransferase|nr:N-acetylmannosaminyltransferase [Capsulimonas sp.]
MDSVHILGLRVDRSDMSGALAQIEQWIAQRGAPKHVVTADASMVVLAHGDPELARIVENADLVTPDGAGILWASKLLRSQITNKVSGVDLVSETCRLSAERGYRIYFLGAAPEVAAEAARNLEAKYPGAKIVGTRDGYFKPEEEGEVVQAIRDASPDVLFVAFGIPKQEKWITRLKEELGVPVSLGIGGSFDVYSGRVKRAPVWMQKRGLEWLYRLCSNPKKITKVMTLPQFAIMTLRQRFLGAS